MIAPIAATLLASCGTPQESTGNGLEPDQRLSWRAASGGGQVAQTAFNDPDVSYASAEAVRCWKVPHGQDCLAVSYSSALGYSARRFTMTALPATQAAADKLTTGAGYSCGYVPEHGLTRETIAGPNGRLVEQSWLAFSPKQAWTKRYVTGFLRDNRIGGSPWFRCADLMKRLREGSIGTVGTTAVAHALLG